MKYRSEVRWWAWTGELNGHPVLTLIALLLFFYSSISAGGAMVEIGFLSATFAGAVPGLS